MKRSCVLLLAFCGVMAVLLAPGIASANGPTTVTGWIPPLDNTITLPNTGGSAGPEWGKDTGVDCHGDASPFMRDPNGLTTGPVYGGVVLTWVGTPPSRTSLPATLQDLLTGPDGSKVNDLVVFAGDSYAVVISEPVKSLLPFDPNLPNGSDPYALWALASYAYGYNKIAIPEIATQIYTPYTPQDLTWPGWDPTVPDWQYYTVPDRWNSDYPPPNTWTQYTFLIQNDNVTVPEPGALLLLGFGLMALAGMRRVVKANA